MTEAKNYPSHTITFAEKQLDERGRDKLGKPVEVATVWPRTKGKQGGSIQWHVSPKNLGDGAWFVLDKERQQTQDTDAFDRADEVQAKEQGLSR